MDLRGMNAAVPDMPFDLLILSRDQPRHFFRILRKSPSVNNVHPVTSPCAGAAKNCLLAIPPRFAILNLFDF